MPPSVATTTCLRPLPDEASQAAFWPLFNERNAVIERQGEVTELMFAAAKRNDMVAHGQHKEQLEALKLEEERLSRELRPYQFTSPRTGEPS